MMTRARVGLVLEVNDRKPLPGTQVIILRSRHSMAVGYLFEHVDFSAPEEARIVLFRARFLKLSKHSPMVVATDDELRYGRTDGEERPALDAIHASRRLSRELDLLVAYWESDAFPYFRHQKASDSRRSS
ncbi:MAG: hypothetical protein LKI34_04605 [Bifidobacterium tibiigranuli]|jgi:hypothetical protein|uniref:hypothetical protein n=1 Tax=Bifidobacterium tibiigranuli TaxID=2172043 RepID=UPI0026F30AD7|nr:hypothetical protein [Bifidobacterium tibiigranuli]MCI1673482.1 hypothetical protein [Bifidobacterium tibiigranuli]MCI1712782.1 hypothetical protein [Bifidobacterium tibiigranuli]MCI1833515.1 hypothetical protein [Bifidobacterium tibiigranuli]